MKKNKFSLDTEDEEIQIDKNKLEQFTKGANTHSIKIENIDDNWKSQDKYAQPNISTTLRLNKFEAGLIREVAKKEVMSINSLIRKILITELEKKL